MLSVWSPAVRGRGLKRGPRQIRQDPQTVAPRAGAWIETAGRFEVDDGGGVKPDRRCWDPSPTIRRLIRGSGYPASRIDVLFGLLVCRREPRCRRRHHHGIAMIIGNVNVIFPDGRMSKARPSISSTPRRPRRLRSWGSCTYDRAMDTSLYVAGQPHRRRHRAREGENLIRGTQIIPAKASGVSRYCLPSDASRAKTGQIKKVSSFWRIVFTKE